MALIQTAILTPAPGPFPKGRRCTHEADGVRCITLLCSHDPGPTCFIHSKPEEATLQEQRESFEDLMAA